MARETFCISFLKIQIILQKESSQLIKFIYEHMSSKVGKYCDYLNMNLPFITLIKIYQNSVLPIHFRHIFLDINSWNFIQVMLDNVFAMLGHKDFKVGCFLWLEGSGGFFFAGQ